MPDKLLKVLLLGQPQCPKCYAILNNQLKMDVTNYLNNTVIFIHPSSELCKDSNLVTEEFKLVDFIHEIKSITTPEEGEDPRSVFKPALEGDSSL